jgi:glycolate oxidase FAD binding subunit
LPNGFEWQTDGTVSGIMLKASAIEEKLRAAVGSQNLRAATDGDSVCGVLPQFVAEPENEEQLASLLSCANEVGVAVIPRGGGTKLVWGNPPKKAEVILSTARLDRVLEHAWADLTVTVQAGCTVQALQNTLARHDQRLACDCLWPDRSTIGGLLSTNDSGALRLRFGSLRDLIIGMTLALPDGTLASSGGKVVKNVAGYDLPKLATGALGTLGVITRAVFRVHPLPHCARTLSFSAQNFQTIQQQVLSIQDSKLAHTALQIRCVRGGQPAADILFEATEAGIQAQESQLRDLLASTRTEHAYESVWMARQELWSSADTAVILKISVLPAEIANLAGDLEKIANSHKVQWWMVAQATGIGAVRLAGEPDHLSASIEQLRAIVEGQGGSLVILHRPNGFALLDAWGNPGDALALMQAVKQQLDPKLTLNPGRFVGGI